MLRRDAGRAEPDRGLAGNGETHGNERSYPRGAHNVNRSAGFAERALPEEMRDKVKSSPPDVKHLAAPFLLVDSDATGPRAMTRGPEQRGSDAQRRAIT
jgi:hypothetical protein